MKTIYLAGPMLGLTNDVMNEWRIYVINQLQNKYKFLNPTRRVYDKFDAIKIVEGDKKDIRHSDIILVNHTKPSDGTAMEMIYAWERNKTVYTVVHEKLYSPWIDYHSTKVFKTLDEAINILKQRELHEENKSISK